MLMVFRGGDTGMANMAKKTLPSLSKCGNAAPDGFWRMKERR